MRSSSEVTYQVISRVVLKSRGNLTLFGAFSFLTIKKELSEGLQGY